MKIQLSLFFGLVVTIASAEVTFTNLGSAPGYNRVFVNGVSADGSTVVGNLQQSSNQANQAFFWTASSGIVPMGDLPGGQENSVAFSASADGSVIVGRGFGDNGFAPFIWTSDWGMQVMWGIVPTNVAQDAVAVSADGLIVAGYYDLGGGDYQAWRWTPGSGAVQMSGLPAGASLPTAYGISSDGLVVVGEWLRSGVLEAFRWSPRDGWQGLGGVTPANSQATLVSDDGAMVVGLVYAGIDYTPFEWTVEDGMQPLPMLVGFQRSRPLAMSAGGKLIGGASVSFFGGPLVGISRATLWPENRDPVILSDHLEDVYGLDLSDWILNSIDAISADGSIIAGTGLFQGSRRGWVVHGLPIVDGLNFDRDQNGMHSVAEFATGFHHTDLARQFYEVERVGNSWVFRYRLNNDQDLLIHRVVWSTDLQTWSSTGLSAPVEVQDLGEAKVFSRTLSNGSPKVFFRLEIRWNDGGSW